MGNVEYKILDNLMLGAWVKRDFEGKAMASLVEWSSDRYNTNVEISVSNAKTPKTIATFCASQLYRVNSRWSIGDKSVINMDRTSGCWWAEKNAFGYTAALRYDNERHTAAAVVTLDRAANASLLYQRRLDDALTVGAEVTANARDRTTKVTLLHRATLANGLECKGVPRRPPTLLFSTFLFPARNSGDITIWRLVVVLCREVIRVLNRECLHVRDDGGIRNRVYETRSAFGRRSWGVF